MNFILTHLTGSVETFLQRDLDLVYKDDTKLIDIGEFSLSVNKLWHLKKLTNQIINSNTITRHDTIIAYWSNYIFKIAREIQKQTNCKIEVCCHANDVFIKSYLGWVPERFVSKYWFCCKKTMDWAIEHYSLPIHKTQLRRHPLPPLPLWKNPGLKPITLLNVARNVSKKNLPAVCTLTNNFADHFGSVEFIQIGAEDFPFNKQLSNKVEFFQLTNITETEIFDLMQKANFFIYGSIVDKKGDRDGVPNVLREAKEIGVPIISEYGWANDEIGESEKVLFVNSLTDWPAIKDWVQKQIS